MSRADYRRQELVDKLPPRIGRFPIVWLVGLLVLLGFFLHGLYNGMLSPDRLMAGMRNIGRFLGQAFPPDLSRAENYFWAILETFEMALVGAVIGVLISLPVSLLASRNTTPIPILRPITRGIVAAIRTIPDLVWALVFIVAVGLGPTAGILAIAADTVGFCGRFFSERIEELEPGPIEAMQATGAGTFGVILGAVFPLAFPSFVATSLYALEKSIRSAVVLGLVGAGGIGVELSTAMTLFRYDEALTIILMILVVVMAAEQISTNIRHKAL